VAARKRYRLTEQAEADLDGIDAYLSERAGDEAAEALTDRLFEAFALPATRSIGHRRRDLSDEDLFFWFVDWYGIVYWNTAEEIVVLRVWDGRRDPRALRRSLSEKA